MSPKAETLRGETEQEGATLSDKRLSEEDMDALVQVFTPVIRREVKAEVQDRTSSLHARLSQIEEQATFNGLQQMEGRKEIAGLVGIFTACFGTDGLGGVMGIQIREAATNAKRANALAHEINGNLDRIGQRGWLDDQMAEEREMKFSKKRDRRDAWLKWAIGLAGITGGGIVKYGEATREWFVRHWK